MKQTSVEWLYEILHKQNYIYEDMSEFLKQAKEMEKQQIIDAFNEGWLQCNIFGLPERSREHFETPEQYYNKNFKK